MIVKILTIYKSIRKCSDSIFYTCHLLCVSNFWWNFELIAKRLVFRVQIESRATMDSGKKCIILHLAPYGFKIITQALLWNAYCAKFWFPSQLPSSLYYSGLYDMYNIEIWHLDSFSLDKTTLFSLTKQLAPNQNHQANESGRENVIKYFSREASILQIWNVKKEDYITISMSYQVKFPKLGLHWKILD